MQLSATKVISYPAVVSYETLSRFLRSPGTKRQGEQLRIRVRIPLSWIGMIALPITRLWSRCEPAARMKIGDEDSASRSQDRSLNMWELAPESTIQQELGSANAVSSAAKISR